ncbi:MAG TPA: hypothetical protein VEY07_02110 [Thermoplasmata archaeon]|nr:hypothetical protein [Thermoplasmata archaeon]
MSPKWIERELSRLLFPSTPPSTLRIIRWEGRRGLVEVGHRDVGPARAAWNGEIRDPAGRTVSVTTKRTWGTLRKGKLWLRSRSAERIPGRSSAVPGQ